MNRIELRPDGPHSDDYTIEMARGWAESVRVLNYATGSHAYAGLTYPQTVYTVTGHLAAGAAGFGQLLAQLGDFLTREAAAGRLADDRAPRLAVAERQGQLQAQRARYVLAEASDAAAALARALNDAQQAISGLYVPDSGESGLSGEGSS